MLWDRAGADQDVPSHDMILIDETHRYVRVQDGERNREGETNPVRRCGSLGVGQGLFGGAQIGTPPIYHFGSEELQNRVLPEIFSGEKRICLAITEPEAGSDVKNLSCDAKRSTCGKLCVLFLAGGVQLRWS